MKAFVTGVMFCLGIAGHGVGRAAEAQAEETVHRASVAADGIQRVKIEGGAYFFKPDRVIVKLNVPVELTVSVSKSVIPHSFVMQSPEAGLSIDEELSPTAKTIAFTPSAVGTYPFYCRNKLLFFESHREKGMEGVLEVVE